MATLLERSVVFVGPGNVEQVLRTRLWPHTAWSLANMVLAAADCEPLSDDGSACLGLSEEATCYVSHAYLSEADPFADFVVHEAAHVFHNCKRAMLGCLKPDVASGCWTSTSADARPSPTPARPTAAFG